MTDTLTSYLTSEVEIKYAILPADDFYNLPEQVEVLGVYITTISTTGSPRKVNILGSIGESALMALEDEVIEAKSISR